MLCQRQLIKQRLAPRVLPVAAWLLAIFGSIGGIQWLYQRIQHERKRRHGYSYLGLSRTGAVRVQPAIVPIPRTTSAESPYPFAQAVPFGEVLALRRINEFFVHFPLSDNVNISLTPSDSEFPELLILLGGPMHNRSTKEFLSALPFITINEARGIISVPTIPPLAMPKRNLGPEIASDRALALIGPNPFRSGRCFLLCAGLTTYGTGAIAEYLFANLADKRLPRLGNWEYRGFIADVVVSSAGNANVRNATVTPFGFSIDVTPTYEVMSVRLDDTTILRSEDDSYEMRLAPGSQATCEIVVRNAGRGAWVSEGDFQIRLGTTFEQDRSSPFAVKGSWRSDYRAADLPCAYLEPGATAILKFPLRAPLEVGVYDEAFQLVHELRTWCVGPPIRLKITVESDGART